MDNEEMVKQARRHYARAAHMAPGGSEPVCDRFPAAPDRALPPDEFLNRLLDAAFQNSPKLLHPFAIRLARGEWSKARIQEWVRQDYQRTVSAIRRHALIAANASEYDLIWALITRVKVEADADPVGGVFFALPQLWIKFGISLGLTREEIIAARPHALLQLLNDSVIHEVRFSGAVPAGELVSALLDPIFNRVWGDAIENSLRLPSDALDFFWATAADRWGEENGRALIQKWATSEESQAALWNQVRVEADAGREWQRFSILWRILEGLKEGR